MIFERKLIIWFALLALTGCLDPQPYHPNDCEKSKCNRSSLYQESVQDPYTLGFVEVDDQGMFWDREQFELIKRHAKEASRDKDLLIYVYVHGWQHNASNTDSNVATFKKQLAKMSQTLDSSRWSLLGIYVGWRGRSVDVPILEYTTFWDRQSAAKRVADGSLIELFSYLNSLKKQSITDTKLVTLGHSFGGAIVFTALNKLFSQQLVESSNGDQVTKGIGDLTILINPAFDGLKYAHFHDMKDRYNHFFAGQKPTLAIFTSQNDWATKYAFPVGNALTRSFESTRYMKTRIGKESVLVNQSSAARMAIGHFKPYVSHDLAVSSNHVGMRKSRGDMALYARRQWEQGLRTIYFTEAELSSRYQDVTRAPYLVVSVEPELIPNHNDFSGREFEGFLHEFIMMSVF
ncbi:alpha/beta hydrolase [Vibrio sonorensis]|uniref:alpha/beta hydrolase n=1 Tax=Vibrio sonorensis TaxID=1004316 RepID=UPI0008DA5471|nr:alpha/beta hydrolase [Vibrio sonorensis]